MGKLKILGLVMVLSLLAGCGTSEAMKVNTMVSDLREINDRVADNLQILTYAALVRSSDADVVECLNAVLAIVGKPSEMEETFAKNLSSKQIHELSGNSEELIAQAARIKKSLRESHLQFIELEIRAKAMDKLMKLTYGIALCLLCVILIKKIF